MWVVVYGNAFDGLSMVGPFLTCDAANAYADGGEGEWSVVEISAPPSGHNSPRDLLDRCSEALDEAANMLTDEMVLPCEQATELADKLTELAMDTRDATRPG